MERGSGGEQGAGKSSKSGNAAFVLLQVARYDATKQYSV